MPFLEASAKEATNVEEAFLTMAKELIEIRAQMGEQVNAGGQQVSLSIVPEAKKGFMLTTTLALAQISANSGGGRKKCC